METNAITEQDIQELTLALLYLNAWRPIIGTGKGKERLLGELTAWKGHDFGTLDSLQERDFIYSSHKSKSLYITDEGEQKAKEIIHRLLGKVFEVSTEIRM